MGNRDRAPSTVSPDGKPTHRFPDGAFTPEELERMDRLAPVDAEAALAWMRGEGPDPWAAAGRDPNV